MERRWKNKFRGIGCTSTPNPDLKRRKKKVEKTVMKKENNKEKRERTKGSSGNWAAGVVSSPTIPGVLRAKQKLFVILVHHFPREVRASAPAHWLLLPPR